MPVNTRIQLRRGTAAVGANQWIDQVLYAGEIGFESDTGKFKIGDGTTAWNSLGYASILPSELNELVDDRVNALLVAGSNISLTYDDNANTLTIATDGLDNEQVEDIIGTKVQGGDGISVSYNDTSGVTTISLSDPTIQLADITDLDADIKTFLITPSSDNLRAAIDTSTTGTGALVFNNSPEILGSLKVNTIVPQSGSDIQLGSVGAENINIVGTPQFGGVSITSSAAELNLLDGSVANTVVNGKAVVYGSSGEVAVTTLSIGGVAITASASELNVLDGITSSTAELNILDGVTATASEINLVDGSVANTVVNSKAVIYGSSGQIASTSLNASSEITVGTSPSPFSVNSSGNISCSQLTSSGNVTVGGNLIVSGTTTTVNSTVVTIKDPILTLGNNTAAFNMNGSDGKDRGIEYRYFNSSGANKRGFFGFDDSTGKFTFIPDATNTSEVFSGDKGEIDANVDWSNILNKPDPVVTVTLEGDVTGTANTTLTDLASGTVTVSTTIAANSVALGTDTTGNYVATVTAGSYATVSGSGSETAAVTVGVDATSANTASKVVARDASGNFSAGTIAADLTGTATNALNVEVDSSSSNINHLVFVNGTNGNLKPSVNSNLRFDAVNNELLGDDSTTPTTKLKYFVIDGGTP